MSHYTPLQLPLPVYGLLTAEVQWSGLGLTRQQQLRNSTHTTSSSGGGGSGGSSGGSAEGGGECVIGVDVATVRGAVSCRICVASQLFASFGLIAPAYFDLHLITIL